MIKILLIEDNEFIIDIYKRSFNAWNTTHPEETYQVEVRLDGNSGLQSALSSNFDIILLDIMLPDKSGIEILKEIKNDPNAKSIPVCMLTNLGSDEVMNQAYQFGAIGYIVKSNFTPDQVVEQVRSFAKSIKT